MRARRPSGPQSPSAESESSRHVWRPRANAIWRLDGRKPKLTAANLKAARALGDSSELVMAEIAEQVAVSRNTLYRNLREAG